MPRFSSLLLALVLTPTPIALAAPAVPAVPAALVETPATKAAVLATAPTAIQAVKDQGGSIVTSNTETANETQTTTAVVTQPQSAGQPKVVTATTTIVQVKTPKDMVGWASGGMHNMPQILAFFTFFMGMMRALAEVMTELAVFSYALAKLTTSPRLKRVMEMVGWGLSIFAWMIAIFGTGSPKKFADQAFVALPAPQRPQL